MPMSTRELYLVLRARDEASRTLRGLSRELLSTGAAASSAAARAESGIARETAARARREAQAARDIAMRIRDQAFQQRVTAATARATAATVRDSAAMERSTAARIRDEAAEARLNAQRINAVVQTHRKEAAEIRERLSLMRMGDVTMDQVNHMRRLAIEQDKAARDAQVMVRNFNMEARELEKTARAHDAASRAAEGLSRQHVAVARSADDAGRKLETMARGQDAVARGHDRSARAALAQAQALDQNAREAEAAAERHRHLISITEQSGIALATAGVGMVAFGVVGVVALKNLVQSSMEYERQVRLTATQIDGFTGNLQQLGDIGKRVANEFAVPFKDIQPALYDIFSSTEASVADAEMMLKSFAKAAVAGQVDIQDASRATIGILNAFSLPLKDTNKILDIQFELVKEGVGTYAEWADKIGLVSPSAARAGQSVEVMTAALATATRMGMSTARATTSVARAMDAMSHPKVIDGLKKMGINAYDAAGHMRPLNETLRDLRTAIMKLPEKDRVAAILALFKDAGGTIEARRFLQTMLLVPGTLEQFDNILGNIKNSAGAMDKAYSTMADSAASKTQVLANKWEILKVNMGQALTPTFSRAIDMLSKLIDKFNNLSPSAQKTVAKILLLATILSIISGVFLVIVGGIAAFVAAISAAGTVLFAVIGIAFAVVAGLAALGGALMGAYQNSEGFRTIVTTLKDKLKELWDIAVNFAKDVKKQWDQNLKPALDDLKKYIDENVLPAVRNFQEEVANKFLAQLKEVAIFVVSVLGGAFLWIGMIIKTWLKPAVKELTDTWVEHRDQLMPLIEIIIKVLGALMKVAAYIGGVFLIVMGTSLVGAIVVALKVFGWLLDILSATINAWHLFIAIIRVVIHWFGVLREGAMTHLGELLSFCSSIPGRIQGFFNGLGTLLLTAGHALMDGLIEGIKQRMGPLGDMLSAVSNYIRAHKGPIQKDRKLLVPAGHAIMEGLMRGISDMKPDLLDQLSGITMDVKGSGGSDTTFRRPDIPPPPANGMVVKNYYITQNITTQEINPIRQAAALGWEVQTVM